jgi:hypothetical protein
LRHKKVELKIASTQALMDILELPQRQRTADSYRHLAKIMKSERDKGGRGYMRHARAVAMIGL